MKFLMLGLCAALPVSLSSCGSPTSKPEPVEEKDGRYPALRTAKQADQIKTISSDLFTDSRVRCQEKQGLSEDIWRVTKSTLSPDGNPKLVDWGVDDVALRDGQGKIVAVVYTIEPGDPGAITTLREHFLINSDCRVLPWIAPEDISSEGTR